MNPPVRDLLDHRVLILAPKGRDAGVVSQVLAAGGIESLSIGSLNALVQELARGGASLFVTEEALDEPALPSLLSWLETQPPWSDMPIVVLAAKRVGRRPAEAAMRLERLGNVMLLERPLNAETLVSAARSALRARGRQYQIRAYIDEQVRINAENARLNQAEWLALQQAAQAREALAMALDAAELGTFHCPMPLGVIEWNATCKAHFWLLPDAEVDFQLFYALIHPDDRERVRQAVSNAVDGRKPYDVEYRTVGPHGEHRWIRAKGSAYYDESGQPTRFDGITIDISRQKSLQIERESLLHAEKAAREEAERVSRMKDEFLATLSHELRTPLSAILGWTHVMRRHGPSAAGEFAKGVDTIERNARAQARLIEDLLDMSRIVAGNARLEIKMVDPVSVLEAAILSVQPAASAKGIEISTTVEGPVDMLSADPHRLQQMLWNLLSNAVKFTPPEGEVRVSLACRASDLEFTVSDNGDGIDQDFLPFVFDRFRQADSSKTRSHGGLGLGLAIVRHLAELHGGSVAAASDGPGHGASFSIRLPMRTALTLTEAAPPKPMPAEESLPTPLKVDLSGLDIVAVDDEPDGQDLLVRILGAHGANIIPASSADEAMRAIRSKRPAVLISDIGMPKVDGYELLRRVRAFAPDVPAIALTAFAAEEDRRLALDAGYRVHLSKPVEPGDLLEAIAAIVNRAVSD